MQLYDPREAMTPTQRKAHIERRNRRDRLAARALAQLTQAVAPDADTAPTARVWTARHLRHYSRPMWFHNLVYETEDLLPKILAAPASPYPSIKLIQAVVSDYYDIREIEMLSARRSAVIVLPRHVAYFLSKALTRHSLTAIARLFGGRNHTSILSGIRKIERLLETDPLIAEDIAQLTKTLGSMTA